MDNENNGSRQGTSSSRYFQKVIAASGSRGGADNVPESVEALEQRKRLDTLEFSTNGKDLRHNLFAALEGASLSDKQKNIIADAVIKITAGQAILEKHQLDLQFKTAARLSGAAKS